MSDSNNNDNKDDSTNAAAAASPYQRTQPLPSKSRPLVVTAASEKDVLLGRGNQINNRSGNLQYRSYVKERATEYWFCPDKIKKDAIARQVMRKILDSGGRFLKPRSAETAAGEWTQIFEVVDEMSVLGKTKQALRDTAAAKRLDGTSAQVQARAAAAGNTNTGSAAALRSPLLRSLQPPPQGDTFAAALGAAETAPLLSLSAASLPPTAAAAAQQPTGLDILEHLRALQSLGGGGSASAALASSFPPPGLLHTPAAAAAPGTQQASSEWEQRERFRMAHMQRALLQEQLLQNASLHQPPVQWQQQLQWIQQQQQLQLLQQQAARPGLSALDQLLLLQQQQQQQPDANLLALLQQQQQQLHPTADMAASSGAHPPAPQQPPPPLDTKSAVVPDDEDEEEQPLPSSSSRRRVSNSTHKQEDDDDSQATSSDDDDEEEEEELVGLARNARSV